MLPFSGVRKLRPEAKKFIGWSLFLLLLYAAGWVGLWKYDHRNDLPRFYDGQSIGGGWYRVKIGEVSIPPGAWSEWVRSPEYGIAWWITPDDAGWDCRYEVEHDDGSIETLSGNVGKVKKVVAIRVQNGASRDVTAEFFTSTQR